MIDIRDYINDILEKPDGEEVIMAIIGALSTIASDPKVVAQGIDISEELNVIEHNPSGNLVRKAISRALKKLCMYDTQDDPTVLIDPEGFDAIETKEQNCLYLIHDDSEASLINMDGEHPVSANQTNIAPITVSNFKNIKTLMQESLRPRYMYRLTVGRMYPLETIPAYFLDGTKNLCSLYYLKMYGEIKKCAFRNCKYLYDVVIGADVQTIAEDAFVGCDRLQTITIRQEENFIQGAPWGAPSTTQIVWAPIE